MTRKLLWPIIFCLALAAFAAKPQSWRDLANQAIMDGDYKKASGFYEKWTEADPTDAVSLYNLACCLAILKQPDDAIKTLRKAADAGWSDSAYSAEDPDLASLHERKEFRKLLDDFAHNARSRYGGYIMQSCAQERIGQYLVVLPETYDPSRRYPLVILLHGYGQTPEQFAAVAPLISSNDYVYAIPWGSYTVLDGSGFSHLRELDSYQEDRGSLETAAAWILRVADDAARRYPVDSASIWLVGFSQGGALAHVAAARYPQRIAGYAACGGYIIKDAITNEQLAAEKQAGTKVLVLHGNDDKVVAPEEAIWAVSILKRAGLDVSFVAIDGAHHFSPEAGVKVDEWLKAKMNK